MIKMIIIHFTINLKLVGQVKLNEEGDYPVTLYTIDTDGNKSENKNLIVKVN